MPNYPTDRAPPTDGRRARAGSPPRATNVAPLELAAWLEQRTPDLRDRWTKRIVDAGAGQSGLWDGLLGEFTHLFTAFLPKLLGPLRADLDPLWSRAAELFGATAAKRGLAAGEVVEELQVLRELVIRELYRDPPMGGRVPLSLREILQLNRAIDRAVTHGSVGHTDALFFQLFEKGEDPEPTPPQAIEEEVRRQLELIRTELEATLATMAVAAHEPAREH